MGYLVFFCIGTTLAEKGGLQLNNMILAGCYLVPTSAASREGV